MHVTKEQLDDARNQIKFQKQAIDHAEDRVKFMERVIKDLENRNKQCLVMMEKLKTEYNL